ncbi:hypothetical protein AAU61_16840 [Desulfocarbo indianensis]|nr:hypothetical protein AAU61_16840 [Desulfocarbo indianensis]
MERSRDLKAEMRALEADVCLCFQNTLPSKQFHAELMLGVISLELTLKRLPGSRDLEERRSLTKEFLHGVEVIRQGLQLLWETKAGISAEQARKAARWGGRLLAEPLHLPFEVKGLPHFENGGERNVEPTDTEPAGPAAQAG